ncbi:MAG TPA: hypothetical protein VLZ10_17405, partial [Thermodesulfobacteriota bacterium]|nr:hypothetical protein [Thermodesulfobacteriota bacterium]
VIPNIKDSGVRVNIEIQIEIQTEIQKKTASKRTSAVYPGRLEETNISKKIEGTGFQDVKVVEETSFLVE